MLAEEFHECRNIHHRICGICINNWFMYWGLICKTLKNVYVTESTYQKEVLQMLVNLSFSLSLFASAVSLMASKCKSSCSNFVFFWRGTYFPSPSFFNSSNRLSNWARCLERESKLRDSSTLRPVGEQNAFHELSLQISSRSFFWGSPAITLNHRKCWVGRDP